MSENQGTGAAADPQKPAVDIEAIRAETLRAEAKRRAEILALKSKPAFAAYADVIEACASDPDVTIVQAKRNICKFEGRAMLGDALAAECQFTAMIADPPSD